MLAGAWGGIIGSGWCWDTSPLSEAAQGFARSWLSRPMTQKELLPGRLYQNTNALQHTAYSEAI